jgi:hypothetical protein
MRCRGAYLAVLVSLTGVTMVAAADPQGDRSTCNVTTPSGSFATDKLRTSVPSDGTITFAPGGPGFITSDGALGMKFGWERRVAGKLRVTGIRLDGDAPPLRVHAPDGYGLIGFQASYLIFPTPGCWQVDAQVGDHTDSAITFVTRVVKIGAGPSWRLDP